MENERYMKQKEYLSKEDYVLIEALQKECLGKDGIALKLELDYKLAIAKASEETGSKNEINEFMYFDNDSLVGYIGICGFGGALEINGMVHPDYRKQGIFSALNEKVMEECKRRKSKEVLILSDKKSSEGQRFIQKLNVSYDHTEYEMYLRKDFEMPSKEQLCGVSFRKAMNSDAQEIARQNVIYFDDEDSSPEGMILPEVEEKRGMTIYLAIKDDQIIGKIHLETNKEPAGIFGLGVLPEYRGKGYGRAVLLGGIRKMMEDHAKQIMLQVLTENATALNLYTSCGFEETSTMDYYKVNL